MAPQNSWRHLAAALLVLAAAGACADPADPGPVDPPAEFISMRRAWLPGERDSTIARIKLNRSFTFPYVGDISDEADLIYADLDSVTVMVGNPDFGVRAMNDAGLVMAPRFATNWDITGIDVRIVNIEPNPDDSTHWIGVFWSNPADDTWKGFALGAANTNPATVTFPLTSVNTNAFDASFAKSGVGVGEVRAGTSTTWLGNGPGTSPNNTLQITAAGYGGANTITSGPFTGGTGAGGSMNGRMRVIAMARASGSSSPATFNIDYNFTGAAIGAIRYVCIFRTPCTTNVPLIQAAVRSGRPLPDSLTRLLPWIAARPDRARHILLEGMTGR